MTERRSHYSARYPRRMRRRIAVPCFALSLALAHTAAAQDQPTAPILANVHASWTAGDATRGYLDYFRGVNPRPDYQERDGAAIGIGGTLGYRPAAFAELHLGFDVAPRHATRDGVSVGQTETVTSAELRISRPLVDLANVPYIGVGVSSIYASEHSSTHPWPSTTAISGTGAMLFGGVRRRVGVHTALDVGLSLSAERGSRLRLVGDVEKDPHTGTTVVPRVRFGLSWVPSVPVARMGDTASSPISIGRIVRVHGTGDVTYPGTVLAIGDDTILLQTGNGGRLRQVRMPWRCVTSIDVHAGNESRVHTFMSSAVEGLVALSAAALVARYAGETRIASEPGRFAVWVAVPGAALGGGLGLLRDRYRWQRAPLPFGKGSGARTGC